MRVLVVYYSETSNTETVAEGIREEASREHETDLKSLDNVTVEDHHGYDFVFIGSACHDSDLARPMIRFLEAIPENPPFSMAGFYTHSAYTRDDQRFKRSEEVFDKWAARGLGTFEEVC